MKLTAKTKTAPTKEEENVSRNELQFATKLIERSFRYAVNNAVSNLLTHPEYKAARKEIGEIESSIKNHEDAIRELIRRLGGLKDRIAEISEEMAEKYAKDV